MIRVFLADAQREEHAALREMLLDLKMKVVGEAADWVPTLAAVAATKPDLLLVDFDLLPAEYGTALAKLRQACSKAIVILLISHLDARQNVFLSAGADALISKSDPPERVAERLRSAARRVHSMPCFRSAFVLMKPGRSGPSQL